MEENIKQDVVVEEYQYTTDCIKINDIVRVSVNGEYFISQVTGVIDINGPIVSVLGIGVFVGMANIEKVVDKGLIFYFHLNGIFKDSVEVL